ncbi:hypothetical protein ACFFTK_15260 [Pseudonocardia petroleophila]|nr:hypothetical protein [Pseudonocardia petroleophila]
MPWLSDQARRDILGLNSARASDLEVPAGTSGGDGRTGREG